MTSTGFNVPYSYMCRKYIYDIHQSYIHIIRILTLMVAII
jgi:hypothetical protein